MPEQKNPVSARPETPQHVIKSPVPEHVSPEAEPKSVKSPWIRIIAVGVFILLAGIFLLVSTKKNRNQQVTTEKVYHVGVLSALDYFFPQVDIFKKEMTNLGYIEGKNIVYDVQKGPAPVGNQKIVKKFVDDNVDLIFVFPTEASIEAKEGTKGTNIPIISNAAYVEGNGLIESISHPGGNITGVRFPIAEVSAKRLELLHEIVPKATRIWVPYLKDYPTVAPSLVAVKQIAQSLGLTIIESPFADPSEVVAFLKTQATNPSMDAILFMPEPLSIIPPYIDQIYPFADTHKLPIVSATLVEGDTGPILALIPSNEEFAKLAAPLADKILKGTNAGDIPIVTPENDLEINYKAIQKLGLTIDESLLSTAKRIIR